MTPEQFTYWLQGFAEMQMLETAPSLEQWRMIKEHLNLVFNKVTPPKKSLEEQLKELQQIQPVSPAPFKPWPGKDSYEIPQTYC